MAFSTLYDLMQTAREGEPLGKSDWGSVAGFPTHEFKGYVMKAHSRRPLDASTALTPVNYHLNVNFGQPVLLDCEYEGKHAVPLSILGKVPGKNLLDIKKKIGQRLVERSGHVGDGEAHAYLLEHLANLPDFTFERWMQGKRYQLEKGIGGDNHLGNIMYDEATKSLRDIDVVESGHQDWHYHNTNDVLKRLYQQDLEKFSFVGRLSSSYRRQKAAAEIIKEKVTKAAGAAGVPVDSKYFDGKTPPEFAPSSLKNQLGQVVLSDPPEKLSAMLKEMETQGHIPLR